eukprot:TRINITY_DN14999_c0_g2_i5.p1 TRINITY_DN14999_c0_g2~~TRINITY_DN14999_c0_g2_i5.p1  ORF type:complete len:420 (-),score=81.99 TRINITY_DN14999_c0_g2_i5:249-1508(-)
MRGQEEIRGKHQQLYDTISTKKLELARQAKHINQKLQILESIESLSVKELELELFDLWDIQNKGAVPVGVIAEAILNCQELVTKLSLYDLIDMERRGEEELDRAAFGRFVHKIVDQVGDFKDWCQLLVLQHKLPEPTSDYFTIKTSQAGDADADVESGEEQEDGRMRNLFALFDMDMDGKINFKDIVMGLTKVVPMLDMVKASEAAVQVLLLFDSHQERSLDYKDFVRFMGTFLKATNVEFSKVADKLLLAAARADPPEDEFKIDMEEVLRSSEFKTFMDMRLHKIFWLWDKDQDGYISFKELCMGLTHFSPDLSLQETMKQALELLGKRPSTENDNEYKKKLDRSEFAHVITKYVERSGASFHQVADYLVAMSVSEPQKVTHRVGSTENSFTEKSTKSSCQVDDMSDDSKTPTIDAHQ